MHWTQVELAVTAGGGHEFEVVCIRPGRANGLEYPATVLKGSLALWDGVTSFVDHAGPQDRGRPGYRSVRDVCGVISLPKWDEARGIVARLQLAGRAGSELGPLLTAVVRGHEKGAPVPNVGLSADLLVGHDGERVCEITRVLAVDVVVNPAAGGRVERILNGGLPATETIRLGADVPPPAGHEEAPEPAPEGDDTMQDDNTPSTPQGLVELQDELEEIRSVRRELASAFLQASLANSGLPEPMQQAVRMRLAQQPGYTAAEVLREVDAERTLWAALQEERTVRHLGPGPEVSEMQSELDRLQLACERLLGAPLPDAAAGVPRLTGLRELYLLLTGDHEMRGRFVAERVTLANVTTSTLPSIVKNALNKVLVAAFESRPQWWQPVVIEEDFPTLNSVTWITLGGFGDLATVNEGAAYQEVASLSDSGEVSPWTKKGGYIGITLETIDRDNVAAVRQIPRKLGLAAWRTLSSSIAGLFTANSGVGPYWPASQSTYRLFDAQYGNLGASALAASSWDETVQAMYKQTEGGSNKRLGVRPRWLLVPIEMEKTALTILYSTGEPGTGNNDANVRAGSFGVVTVPEFVDANSWAAAADPADLPGICVGYRFGRTPELFLADENTSGTMFTNDEMRIKVRFLYTLGVADPKALYKHNVT